MATEKKICARCGKEIGTYEAQMKDGQPYHQECLDSIELDEHLDFLEQRFPTTDRKLARIIRQNMMLEEYAKQSARALKTIQSVIVLLVVISIIAAILQSCSTF
ncbi:MAG: hypothetical protein GYA45_11665 [Pelolinea sp.]|nr:hypothetical protein [Pelolinea sp.]